MAKKKTATYEELKNALSQAEMIVSGMVDNFRTMPAVHQVLERGVREIREILARAS